MPCSRDHEPDLPRAVSALEDSTQGRWHLKCAGCAYEMGKADAANAEERLRARIHELEAQVVALEEQLAQAAGRRTVTRR